MKMFIDVPKIYLHKQPVDFRKSINGLSLLVEQEMQLSPFSGVNRTGKFGGGFV